MHGQGSDKYDNVRIGLASRLDTIQAAILIEKLKIFPEEIEARNRIARRYMPSRPNAPDSDGACCYCWPFFPPFALALALAFELFALRARSAELTGRSE